MTWLNKSISYKSKSFKSSVTLGFFLGFGLVSNLYASKVETELDLASFLFMVVVGLAFWGIGFNIMNMLISDLLTKLFKLITQQEIEKETLFRLLTWSSIPLIFGVPLGIWRLGIQNVDVENLFLFFLLFISFIFIVYNLFSFWREKVRLSKS